MVYPRGFYESSDTFDSDGYSDDRELFDSDEGDDDSHPRQVVKPRIPGIPSYSSCVLDLELDPCSSSRPDSDNDVHTVIDLTMSSPLLLQLPELTGSFVERQTKAEAVDIDLTVNCTADSKIHSIASIVISPSPSPPIITTGKSTFTKKSHRPETPVIDLSDSPIILSKKLPKSDSPLPAKQKIKPEPLPLSSRPPATVVGDILLGSTFHSWEEGKVAIFAREERLGHKWRIGQSKKLEGSRKKVTLRCNHYYHHRPTHSNAIDPSDHRRGKTIKTNCTAHVNLNRIANSIWHVTFIDWTHNHDREIPPGGFVPRPPTREQRKTVDEFSQGGNFTRDHIARILSNQFPDHPLERRQITNLINAARGSARQEVNALGGDAASIIASLRKKDDEEHGWRYELKLDENQVVVGLWWQSPAQAELTCRFSDILVNDNTYNRNQYSYPLNIGIIVDNFGKSRNAWYALHRSEDTPTLAWVFQCHLESAGTPPEILASDRHGSLIAACSQVMPLTHHIYCLHHLNGNVTINVRPSLGPQWNGFTHDFWATYRAVSPEDFERLWRELMARYPAAQSYMDAELYPARERWAWAWIGRIFTAGIRTNGRSESENRITRVFGGPKKTLLQLFDGLNERAISQTMQEMVHVREVCHFQKYLRGAELMVFVQSSRRQHPGNLESLFSRPIELLRKYAGPYAVQTSYTQMQESVYYKTEVVQRPPGVRTWASNLSISLN